MIEKIAYPGLGEAYKLTDGRLEAIITAAVGPRIIRLGFVGGPNEFAELPRHSIPTMSGEWRLYGGHRFWHSPESNPRSYYPDNDPIEVEVGGDYVEARQPVEPPTGMRKTLRITVCDGFFDVDHVLANEGPWPVEAAPWAISVMAPGGVALLPQAMARDPANLLPNRLLSIWPYTDLRDARLRPGADLIRLYQDSSATAPIKIGINNDRGWAAYANGGRLFTKRFTLDPSGVYPDFGCTVESYTNADMLELESLGPLVLLEPGDATYHTERWYLTEAECLPLDDEEALMVELTACVASAGELE